jgi:hypothetical protein
MKNDQIYLKRNQVELLETKKFKKKKKRQAWWSIIPATGERKTRGL